MAEARGVLVIAEVVGGVVVPVTHELLGAARRLAAVLGEPVLALAAGSGMGKVPQDLIARGADKVYVTDEPLFAKYQTDVFVALAAKAVKEISPRVVLLGHDGVGRDLAPRLAFRLGSGLANDCIELRLEGQELVALRPVYGGAALAEITCAGMPKLATVRVKALDPLAADPARKGEVVAYASGLSESTVRARMLEVVKQEAKGLRLEDARIIVSGGRGIGGPEGFQTALKELTDTLGAAQGASRAACDSGYCPPTWQIGLTGKVVGPDLYFAIAISGASQHLAGISGAKNVVAINKDPEANMFKESRWGIVGDWKQVVPALTQACKELLGK